MSRPYVIIHTHTALDGNINGMDLPEFEAATRYYQDIALTPGVQQLDIGVYVNGKNTAEDNITHYRTPKVDPDAVVPAGDFHAVTDPGMYYVSIDPRGELDWPISDFDYGGVRAHVLEVLSEAASDGYKDFLRRRGISYIVAGTDRIDYAVLLDKLGRLGIERVMIGGGGTINWSFLQAGLVDEVGMVLAPIANGDPGAPRFFTAKEPYTAASDRAFDLKSVEHLGDGVVWLRYTPKAGGQGEWALRAGNLGEGWPRRSAHRRRRRDTGPPDECHRTGAFT